MSDLRKCAIHDRLAAPPIPTVLIDADVSRVWGIAWESAIRAALAAPPSIDALIAEIDGLEVQVFDISRRPWVEEAYHKDDIKPILDKYRSAK